MARTEMCWAALLVLGLCLQGGSAQTARKNVLLIVGDDAGFEMGAYNNTDIRMPNMDNLAARSVLFTRAYSSDSSSTPSRAALLTGLPSHQSGQYGLSGGVFHFTTFDNVLSLPRILANNNIRTGIIGKKDVKPDSVYPFDYENTEETWDLETIGRNITVIKQAVREFLTSTGDRPFFLHVSLRDPARCANASQYGQFCELYGNGQSGMGLIPDWKPVTYDPLYITVPYFLPELPATHVELANMYTAYSRMDQGIGLIMSELQTQGVLNETLVVYTSTGSIPFPMAKTNMYESGMATPLLISSPQHPENWGKRTSALASTVDLMPTMMAWLGVNVPNPTVKLTGKSLLPLTINPTNVTGYDRAFSSHTLDEVTMYYPMRAVHTPQYHLIHNLNYRAAFPLSADMATSPTYVNIANNTRYNGRINWIKSMPQYFFREQWEMFDVSLDPTEIDNTAGDPVNDAMFTSLQQELMAWQEVTSDPWRCLPSGVLLADDTCLEVGNREP